jgi:hypothetical protein
MPAAHMRYTQNTHSSETVENRMYVDITFFTQDELRNHFLKLQYKITEDPVFAKYLLENSNHT